MCKQLFVPPILATRSVTHRKLSRLQRARGSPRTMMERAETVLSSFQQEKSSSSLP